MPFITAAAIGAGAGIVGDLFSSSGQQSANQMNMQIAQMNNQFNAQQAQLNRDWETQMSNTQMERRVADLKSANLNPLLAIQAGGASSPMAGAATAAGLPNIQNPAASFGNLGQVATTALQTAKSMDLLDAQTKKTISETPTPDFGGYDPSTGEVVIKPGGGHELGDATVKSIQATTGLNQANANQVAANIEYIKQQVQSGRAQQLLSDSNRFFQDQQTEVLRATKQFLIQQASAAAASARAQESWMKDPNVGPIVSFLQAITAPVHAAVGVMGAMK